MPVLKANAEAEALCAELNREGYVDACITADSDAFLYGAQCVIKTILPKSKVRNSWACYVFPCLLFHFDHAYFPSTCFVNLW